MKKYLPLILLAGFGSPVFADITHRMSSSLQLTTNAAATQVERIGSTYSVSGSGVSTDVGGGGSADLNVGGLGTLTDGVGQGSIATATHTAGTAFSFSQSFIEGDVISTMFRTQKLEESFIVLLKKLKRTFRNLYQFSKNLM